jgi:hypothetical protein
VDETTRPPTREPDETPPPAPGDPAPPGDLTPEQLAQLRDTLIAANPAAVPELIAGDTFAALLASVGPARAAYARISEAAARGGTAGIPRGGSVRAPDTSRYDGLSPEGKIAAGLATRGHDE